MSVGNDAAAHRGPGTSELKPQASAARALVDAVDRLLGRLFSLALATAGGVVIYAVAFIPLRPDDVGLRAYVVGIVLLGAWLLVFARRTQVFVVLRRHPWLTVLWSTVGIAALWVDGSPNSTYFVVAAGGIASAAVLGRPGWAFASAALVAVTSTAGLLVWDLENGGRTSAEAAEHVVTNAFIPLLITAVLALPIWAFRCFVGAIPATLDEIRRGGLPPGRSDGTLSAGDRLSLAGPSEATRPSAVDRIALLTRAERRVVRLLAEGMPAKVIGINLEVKPSTVRTHLRAAKRKTGARTLAGLAALAAEADLERERMTP